MATIKGCRNMVRLSFVLENRTFFCRLFSVFSIFFKNLLTNHSLFVIITSACGKISGNAAMAQLVEHILGKDEVPSSNLGSSSRHPRGFNEPRGFGFI